MFDRWGLGPLFKYEWIGTSRRWQYYAGRCLFIGLLLAAFSVVWLAEHDRNPNLTLGILSRVGEKFFYALVGTQITLILIAVPAITASTLCQDKASGTLMHIFTTDLSNAEIIQGKLGARMISILGYVLCGLPVMCLGMLIGGIDPGALLGAFLVSLGAAIVGGTLAMLLSVWCQKTYEVLLVTYMIWAALLIGGPIMRHLTPFAPPLWFEMADPYWLAFAPYNVPGSTSLRECGFYLFWSLILSCSMVVLAIYKLRKVAIKQSHQPIKERKKWYWQRRRLLRWMPGVSLNRNPVLWYEVHRRKPSRWVQVVFFIYGFFAVIFTFYAVWRSIEQIIGNGTRSEINAFINAFMVAIGLLFVSVISVTSLTEERLRGSLDVLLTTPLSSAKIVWGKWWGAYRSVIVLAILPTIIVFFMAVGSGRLMEFWIMPLVVLSFGAAFTSLGLALAVWIRRPGRALAVSVIAYVISNVLWIFMMILFQVRGDTPIPSGSPWFASGWLTAEFDRSYGQRDRAFEAALIWSVIYGVAAIFLYIATLKSFDHCMGRMKTNLLSATLGAEYEARRRARNAAKKHLVDRHPDNEAIKLALPANDQATG